MDSKAFYRRHDWMQQRTFERQTAVHKKPGHEFNRMPYESEGVFMEYPIRGDGGIVGFADVCEVFHHYAGLKGIYVHFEILTMFPTIKSAGLVLRSLQESEWMVRHAGHKLGRFFTARARAVVSTDDPGIENLRAALTLVDRELRVLRTTSAVSYAGVASDE